MTKFLGVADLIIGTINASANVAQAGMMFEDRQERRGRRPAQPMDPRRAIWNDISREVEADLRKPKQRPARDMLWLQNSLNKLGAQPVLTVDGKYGDDTKQAVADFQTRFGRGLEADGWAGAKTQAAIEVELVRVEAEERQAKAKAKAGAV